MPIFSGQPQSTNWDSISGLLTDSSGKVIAGAITPKVAAWIPVGNSTNLTLVGSVATTAVGTATIASFATTNLHQSLRRLDYLVTVPSTSAIAGFRYTAAQWWRGDAANRGGFYFMCQWGIATGASNTTTRAFVGMTASTAAPTDVEPSTLVSMIGMGWDAADTNIQLYHNDNAGTAVKVDLGASFPVPTVDREDVYEISLYCEPNSSSFDWQVKNLATSAVISGTVSSELPTSTDALSPRGWVSVGGTSSVVGFAFMSARVTTNL